jgi:hypothetical protein
MSVLCALFIIYGLCFIQFAGCRGRVYKAVGACRLSLEIWWVPLAGAVELVLLLHWNKINNGDLCAFGMIWHGKDARCSEDKR